MALFLNSISFLFAPIEFISTILFRLTVCICIKTMYTVQYTANVYVLISSKLWLFYGVFYSRTLKVTYWNNFRHYLNSTLLEFYGLKLIRYSFKINSHFLKHWTWSSGEASEISFLKCMYSTTTKDIETSSTDEIWSPEIRRFWGFVLCSCFWRCETGGCMPGRKVSYIVSNPS